MIETPGEAAMATLHSRANEASTHEGKKASRWMQVMIVHLQVVRPLHQKRFPAHQLRRVVVTFDHLDRFAPLLVKTLVLLKHAVGTVACGISFQRRQAGVIVSNSGDGRHFADRHTM